jgi:hypothetical protein
LSVFVPGFIKHLELLIPGVSTSVKETEIWTKTLIFDGNRWAPTLESSGLAWIHLGWKLNHWNAVSSNHQCFLVQWLQGIYLNLKDSRSCSLGDQNVWCQFHDVEVASNFKLTFCWGLDIKSSEIWWDYTKVVHPGNTLFVLMVYQLITENQHWSANNEMYDYGNAASDIMESCIINWVQGAAAPHFYGSRASNGVVMIVMKSYEKKGCEPYLQDVNFRNQLIHQFA